MDLIVIIPAGPSEEEESGQAKVGDKVPPWPLAKTKKMTRLLALWVAKKGRPFSITEDPELREAFEFSTNGQFNGPCSETIVKVSIPCPTFKCMCMCKVQFKYV
jgi:hypothetical protein